MIPNLQKILKEWSYRVGVIKPNDEAHLFQLQRILVNEGWPLGAINEFIENLNEIDFKNQDAFDAYNKKHKMRKTTKVTIGDKETTVGDAETGGEKDKEEIIKQTKEKNKELWDKIEKEESPKRKEALKAEYIDTQLDNMLRVSSIERGAGRYNMSREDVQSYRKYLEKIMADPENEPKKSIDKIKEERNRKYGEITEDDIDKFMEDLEGSSKAGSGKSDKYDPEVVAGIKAKVRGKGGPGSSYTTGDAGAERYRNVIRAYLETSGISPITDEVVPFSECQLDHIVSLGNEGQDEPDNWMFMEERFNQYKGKKTDEDIRANLEEDHYLTDAEIAAGEESTKVNKALKTEDRAFWKNKFEKSKGSDNPREVGVSIGQIEKMTKPQLDNFIYGWNLAHPDNELSRYETQKVVHNGKSLEYARGEGKSNPVKPVKDDPSTWGLSVGDKKKVTQDKSMDYEASLKAFKDNRASGGRSKSKEQFIEMIKDEGLATDTTATDEAFANKILEHRTGQLKRDKAIKAKIKAAKDEPGSMENKNKIVKKALSEWDKNNTEPGGKNDKGKFIKDASKRKKSKEWQEWKKNRDIQVYEQWKQFDPTSKLKT
jgi:hypothetical protein